MKNLLHISQENCALDEEEEELTVLWGNGGWKVNKEIVSNDKCTLMHSAY